MSRHTTTTNNPIEEIIVDQAADQPIETEGTPQGETPTVETNEKAASEVTLSTEIRAEIAALVTQLDATAPDQTVVEAMAAIAKLHRRLTRPATETKVTILPDGRKLVGETTEITCIDCGATRIIKAQDAFQVTRCEACQKAVRNAKRAEKRKDKRAEIRLQKEADAALAAQLLAQYKASQAQ